MARNQLGVLNALDAAKTQWYHFTVIVIAEMGFFTNVYDLFSISLITKLLGRIYYHVEGAPKPGTLPPNVAAAVTGTAFVGTLAGQLFFGWLGDKLGRKKGFGLVSESVETTPSCPNMQTRRLREAFISAVFAMQGLGILTGGILALLVLVRSCL
ncbi:Detected protein of confused Function [Hibiscus syriacus]|uniref:Detected protein of confused Function n=1 Tax=Hibiscus syriacus TaxID=106335 RepID=A0A6A3D5G2_HIBSY|nr:Detected protein of confused Function [Hibiscus syriacus]